MAASSTATADASAQLCSSLAELVDARVRSSPPGRSQDITCFESDAVPVTFEAYFRRFPTYLDLNTATYLGTMILFNKLTNTARIVPTQYNAHRLWASALLLSAKMHEDLIATMPAFAKLSGVSAAELQRLELTSLKLLEWDCRIDRRELLSLVNELLRRPSTDRRHQMKRQLLKFARTMQQQDAEDAQSSRPTFDIPTTQEIEDSGKDVPTPPTTIRMPSFNSAVPKN
mmetsp:Transcript_39457/g.85456  ORF Transcript_39457/g.85456 Transcript_39457/m.85456 type:complete len:229 (-) Transcript_39457:71-757(-)